MARKNRIATSGIGDGQEDVLVTSRLYAWWLTAFRGCRVKTQTETPQRGVFGRIRYRRTWWLEWISGEEERVARGARGRVPGQRPVR